MPLEKVSPWPFVGMAGIASAFFLYAASGLIAPWYVVVLMLALWVATLVVATRWWTPHPRRLPWLAAGLIAFWFVAMLGGAAMFGWNP